VLPERIELSTSPLPRECSTTELRQQFQWSLIAAAVARPPDSLNIRKRIVSRNALRRIS
jgi:hypothetical protein